MLSIQEISDRLEIQDLQVAYSTAVDSKDFAALDQVFTPDAHIDLTPFGAIAGTLGEVRAWLAQSMAPIPAVQHLMANPQIRIDGDTATARVMCFNAMALPLPEGDPRLVFLGMWYLDEYVRTPAGWRISRRGQERSWAQGLPEAPAP